MTDNLVTWLRARLDEDERTAMGIPEARRAWTTAGGYPETGVTRVMAANDYVIVEDDTDWHAELVTHIARHDPARVLAEVEAKRRILDLGAGFEVYSEPYTAEPVWESVLRLLALPYADQPGYRDEWRPAE